VLGDGYGAASDDKDGNRHGLSLWTFVGRDNIESSMADTEDAPISQQILARGPLNVHRSHQSLLVEERMRHVGQKKEESEIK
jgi:hypothetical protein